jgi:hypothetical protein
VDWKIVEVEEFDRFIRNEEGMWYGDGPRHASGKQRTEVDNRLP